jgi:hypothetical protein
MNHEPKENFLRGRNLPIDGTAPSGRSQNIDGMNYIEYDSGVVSWSSPLKSKWGDRTWNDVLLHHRL